MKHFSIFAALTLTGCSTSIYEGGERIARIQSDAQGLSYTRSADGSVSLTADSLSNSGPVLAAGKALTPAVGVIGAAIAAGAAANIVDAVRKPYYP